MADSKPYASLSSGLLARKGGAKPAMRPQGFNGFNGSGGGFGGSLEDLGWNDMGQVEEFEHVPSPTGLTPAPRHHAQAPEPEQAPAAYDEPDEEAAEPFEEAEHGFEDAPEACDEPLEAEPEAVAPPPVVEQQRALQRSFAPPAAGEVVALPRRRAAPEGAKAKAAFTLRLDPERHLKLRLASAVTRQSAQQLVTGALDDFLNSLPELDALAARVPAEAGQRNR